MFNFSIIIPHYNNSEDLRRCLDSISEREDTEIIVIDDNSDPEKVDFMHFPGTERPDVSAVFSKGENGKGPGYARNLGIEKARGKWIVFSDSDDYFMPGLNDTMDEYMDSESDIVFFRCKRQETDGNIKDYKMFNALIDASETAGNCEPIAYHFPCPWGKFIKRDFLISNNIRYQKITGGDDILFSIQMAIHIRKYALSDRFLYCVVDRPGSLTRNTQWQGLASYTCASCDAYKLMETVSKETIAYQWTASWWGRLWAENKFRALCLMPRVARTMGAKKMLHCFKKAMKVGRWDWENRER